jgi:hypothetical protein
MSGENQGTHPETDISRALFYFVVQRPRKLVNCVRVPDALSHTEIGNFPQPPFMGDVLTPSIEKIGSTISSKPPPPQHPGGSCGTVALAGAGAFHSAILRWSAA